MGYDDLKKHNGQIYTGMLVGASHNWRYPDGSWHETKLAPDRWSFEFRSQKTRSDPAPAGSGAMPGTGYHWYILADQHVRKIDKDSYDTLMTGLKFKVGHKRPDWQSWSYDYPEQRCYRLKIIEILENAAKELKA